MEKKTIGIITVAITTFLCGLPGLAGLCFGSLALLGNFMPGSGVPDEDVAIVAGFAIMTMGLSLVAIAIPIGIGIWTSWSSKKEQASIEQVLIPEDDF
jgi:hypothetical protein